MNEIRSIDGPGLTLAASSHASAGSESAPSSTALEDRVEISDLARVLQDAWDSAVVQQDKIDDIRAAISRGDYLTNEKLDVALDRALKDL